VAGANGGNGNPRKDKNMATLLHYTNAAMRRAKYEQMEDGKWYASIPGFIGLYTVGSSVEEARRKLYDTFAGWVYVCAVKDENNPPEAAPVR
jgi:predicted RNase H-like HicB family nuclease